ncbi:MAG TPA: family 43 glycosylhydrolase, partial [Acidimicrobiales bacterium]|nr:family 43 glycosylhydrolase [Acidimicrobiales bacterium]
LPPPAAGMLDPPPAPSYAEGRVVPPYDVAMPDPDVMVGGHSDYLYTGAGDSGPPNISVRAFTDLEHLGAEVDAMPALPPWTNGWTWAPDVRHVDGRYVMWFAAADVDDVLSTGEPAKCIGVAVARSPLGPFLVGRQPAICGTWGSIDPRTFVAPDGQLWLDWKADVNAAWGPSQDPDEPQNNPTVLWAQRLAPNGMTLEGPRHELLAATRPWEHKLIEAPDMVYAEGRYYVFFSANPSYQDGDGIGVATCRGPAGPCEEPYAGPILGSSPLGLGPGEESLFTQGGVTWLLFSPTGTHWYRQIAVARIAFSPSGPYVSTFDGAVPGVGPVATSSRQSSSPGSADPLAAARGGAEGGRLPSVGASSSRLAVTEAAAEVPALKRIGMGFR